MQQQIVAMPPRLTLVSSFAGMLLGLVAVILARISSACCLSSLHVHGGAARTFVEAWLLLTWFVFGALFIHTVHQLRTVNFIYVRHTIIDLDYYQPLFHFSRVSALTAVGLVFIAYAWYAAVPGLLLEPMGLAFGALFPAFAVAAFMWPLIGIHNLMVEAKGRALLENASVLKEVRDLLFDHAKERALGGAGELNNALSAIRKEREALLQVPNVAVAVWHASERRRGPGAAADHLVSPERAAKIPRGMTAVRGGWRQGSRLSSDPSTHRWSTLLLLPTKRSCDAYRRVQYRTDKSVVPHVARMAPL